MLIYLEYEISQIITRNLLRRAFEIAALSFPFSLSARFRTVYFNWQYVILD